MVVVYDQDPLSMYLQDIAQVEEEHVKEPETLSWLSTFFINIQQTVKSVVQGISQFVSTDPFSCDLAGVYCEYLKRRCKTHRSIVDHVNIKTGNMMRLAILSCCAFSLPPLLFIWSIMSRRRWTSILIGFPSLYSMVFLTTLFFYLTDVNSLFMMTDHH